MRTPPLGAIEAFLAVAGSPTFRAAADRLALSPSALSRRIQGLEAALGCRVFERGAGAPRLTPAGVRYRLAVQGAMESLAAAARSVGHQDDEAPIRLLAPQSLTIGWILPILPELVAAAPSGGVELLIGRTPDEFRQRDADIGIVASPCDTAGLDVQALVALEAVAAGPPRLADGSRPPRTLSAVLAADRLAIEDPPDMWEAWSQSAGSSTRLDPPKRRFETLLSLYESAAAGLGICLAVPLHANRYFREGRLVALLDLRIPTRRGYALVRRPELAGRRRRRVAAIESRLREHAAASIAEFRSLRLAGAAR
jgi:LysR family glycine cleavage system transcriptional activator